MDKFASLTHVSNISLNTLHEKVGTSQEKKSITRLNRFSRSRLRFCNFKNVISLLLMDAWKMQSQKYNNPFIGISIPSLRQNSLSCIHMQTVSQCHSVKQRQWLKSNSTTKRYYVNQTLLSTVVNMQCK